MARIKTNVVGKVGNISLAPEAGLMALHEAVVNSIHSIDDAKCPNGAITVEVRRDLTASPDENGLLPVRDVVIRDNGIGFNRRNYTSFQTAESTYKLKRGGKGIGRFLWLKVFDHAEVRSVFRDTADQRLYSRQFSFVLDDRNPIVDERLVPITISDADAASRGTTVKLVGLHPEYSAAFSGPLADLADTIIEHHIHYLVDASCPDLILREVSMDGLASTEINLKHRFKNDFLLDTDADSVEVGPYVFEVNFLKVRSDAQRPRHSIFYSADRRVVAANLLVNLIPNLTQALQEPNGENFDVLVLVSGSYFDQHVNRERTKLDIPSKPPTKQALGKPMLSLAEIQDAVVARATDYLNDYLAEIRRDKQSRLQSFVSSTAPQYRSLLRYTAYIDKIRPGLSDDKLDIELHKLRNHLTIENKERIGELLDDTNSSLPNTPEFRVGLTQIINQIADVSQSNLVDYVLQRKLILRLFERVLQRNTEGKHEWEEQVHKIVFPMRKTSDEINYEEHNLWLIDERLAYHRFLQSDTPLDAKDEKSPRPDIVLSFDKGLLYTDSEQAPYDSFTIIEFKRPMRTGYSQDDDPIAQVQRYLAFIQSGDATTAEGRPINPGPGAKYYCYIICDLTKKIRGFADERGFTKSPDNEGYFWYNPNYRAYIELISFDKLVKDSKQRNQILFDKLGIGHV